MDELLSPEAQSNGLSEDELLTSVMAAGGYEINAQTMSVDQTYSEMLATGSLRLIEDVAMREQITGYYGLVAQTVGALEVSTSEGHRAFASRVRGAVGPFNRPGLSEADLEDPAVRARLLNLEPRTDETRAELRFIRSRLDNLANNLARIEGATRALIVALEDYGR